MSRDAENALRDIVAICDGSMNITSRQLEIFDVALRGLGLVESQRKSVMGRWRANRLRAIRLSRSERDAKRVAVEIKEPT